MKVQIIFLRNTLVLTLLCEKSAFSVTPICHIAKNSYKMGMFPERIQKVRIILLFKARKKE